MTDLLTSAQALVTAERERTERLATAFLAAVQALITAQASGDLPAIWRALYAATSAELDLTGDDAPVLGGLHDAVITCEEYRPGANGRPCAAWHNCLYCRDECPLTKGS